MTDSWRIPTSFDDAWNNNQKRMMRQERRPSITNASQILGPGAAPFAVLLNDWNEEAATFNGIYYSEPGTVNAPDTQGDPEGTPSTMYWLGETFGCLTDNEERYGFQRLTRIRVTADTPGGAPAWTEYRRRFFPQGELVAYTAWDLL